MGLHRGAELWGWGDVGGVMGLWGCTMGLWVSGGYGAAPWGWGVVGVGGCGGVMGLRRGVGGM